MCTGLQAHLQKPKNEHRAGCIKISQLFGYRSQFISVFCCKVYKPFQSRLSLDASGVLNIWDNVEHSRVLCLKQVSPSKGRRIVMPRTFCYLLVLVMYSLSSTFCHEWIRAHTFAVII